MANSYLDKLNLEQDPNQNNSKLSYQGVKTPVEVVRPKAGLLKQILGRDKESEQFSPYKKKEAVKPTKIERKTIQPAPMAMEPVSPIQEDILAPIAPMETRVSKKPEMLPKTPEYDLGSDYTPVTAEDVKKEEKKVYVEGQAVIRKAIKRAGDIAYSGERKPAYPRDVWENETRKFIENGDYEVYQDAGGGLSVRAKAPDFLEAVWLGQKAESQRLKDAFFYYMTPEDKKGSLLEWRRIQNQLEVPEEESTKAAAGRMIGQVGGQVLTTGAAMAVPGVGLVAGSALAALPQAIAQGLDSEEEAFNISRNNGLDEYKSYDVAKQGRNTYLATGFAEGFVGALVNSRVAKFASALGPVTSKTFLSAARKMAGPGLEIGSDALLAAGMSVIRDAKMSEDTGTDIDMKQRAIENAELEAAVGLAFTALGYGYGKAKPYFPKWMKSQSLNMISELDRGFVQETLKQQQQEGVVDEEATKKILEDLDNWEETKKANIDVRPEAIPTVNGLQQKIVSLNEDLKNANESSKPAILNEIDLINKQIEKAKTSTDPLSAEIDDVTRQPISGEVKPTEEEYFNQLHRTEKFDDNASVSTYLGHNKNEKNIFYTLPNKGIISYDEVIPNTNRFTITANAKNDTPADIKNAFKRIEKYLPANHELLENKSISVDGLRIWDNFIKTGKYVKTNETNEVELTPIDKTNIFKDLKYTTETKWSGAKFENKNENEALERVKKYIKDNNLDFKVKLDGNTIKVEVPVLKYNPTEAKETTKPQENATTISKGQEGPTTGGVSEYQGVEGEQPQTTNEADNRNRPISSETQQEITRPEIFSTQEQKNVFEKMRDAAEKQYAKSENDVRGATQKAIKILKNSEFYKNLEGNAREAYIVEATKYFQGGLETTPSIAKAIGKVNKKITVNEMTALKRLMRFGEQSSKGAVDYVNSVRNQIASGLSKLEARGVIKNSQLKSIVNKSNKLNLLNAEKVNKFVDYVGKVISDATFDEKFNNAQSVRDAINKASKIKNREPNLVAVAKRFSALNPLDVENIDEYTKIAESVYGGLRGTMVSMKSARYNQAFSTSEVNDYIDNQVQYIENNRKQEALNDYDYLVQSKSISGEMTLQEIEQMIDAVESNQEIPDIEDKIRYVRAYTNERFGKLSAFAKDIIDGGSKSLGFEVDENISKSDKEIMSTIIKNGINELPINDAYKVVQSLDNFIANGSHYGLLDVIKRYEGNMAYKSINYKARPLSLFMGKSKVVGRIWANYIQNMNMTLFSMFRTVDRTVDFMNKTGILDMETNKTKAKVRADKYMKDYINKFSNAKANGLDIHHISNAVEQDIFAYLRRNQGGSDIDIQNTFDEQKIVLEQSIRNIENSQSEKQLELAKIYREVFDKIAKDSYNISDVESKVDKNNVSVVNYWTNAFSEVYPDLQQVAKDVYGEILGQDMMYTPIKWRTVDETIKDIELDLAKYDPYKSSTFTFNYDQYIPRKKSGTLFKRKNLKNAPKGKYMQLNFVYKSNKAMQAALIDVYTAGDIRKVKSFLDSDGASKIITNKEDLKLLREKISLYVKKSRNMEVPDYDDLSGFLKQMSRMNRYIVSSSLTSLKQFPSQTLPMMLKTIINSGGFDFKTAGSIASSIYFNKDSDVNRFLDEIGYGISIRGLESTGNIKSLELALTDINNGAIEKGLQKLDKHNEKWLRYMLANGDKIVARATWITYYKKNLKAQGYDVTDIDWDTHKIDKIAAAKAEMEVNLQQNVSDADLQSKLMGSNDAIVSTLRNIFMTLSGFVMNSKSKLYVDLGVITDKGSTMQERGTAFRSFLATSLELSAFSSIMGMSMYSMTKLAKLVFEGVSSEKEDEDRDRSILETIVTNTATDVFSPAPPLNDMTASEINALLDKLDPDTPKDLKFRLFDNGVGDKPWYQKVGLMGIGVKKIADAARTAKASITGEVTTEFQGQVSTKTLSPEEKQVLQIANVANALYLSRLVPFNELATFANRVYKMAEKRALTDKQLAMKDVVAAEDLGSKEVSAEGRTISTALARAANFKDPESRAKYIIDQSTKFKDQEAFLNGIDVLKESGILDNATFANMEAIQSGDDSLIKMAKIFSYKKQDARVAKLLELRAKIGIENFYNSLGTMQQYRILSNDGFILFAEKLVELPDYTDDEGAILISFIED